MSGDAKLSKARDLLVFNVFTGLAAVHFLLKTIGTPMEEGTWIYTLMWIMSLVLLLWLRVYGGERGDVVDYDENLRREHLPWIFGGLAGIIVVSTVIVSAAAGAMRSVLYVPRPSALLSGLPVSATLVDDLLYNFVLVAPAEETVKLMGILTLYRKTGNEIISVCVPVGIWAVLHAYHAYLGPLQPVLVLSAFISGLILYAVLKYTKSLQNAIITHGLYNSLVILIGTV